MKNIPMALLEYLMSTDVESGYVVDLFKITLQSGQVILATNGQLPITYAGDTYEPRLYGGWRVTRVRTALGMTQSTCEFQLQAGVDTVLAPFDIPILEAIQLGLFDAAVMTVYRTYSTIYGDTGDGVEIKYSGQITELNKTGRTLATGSAEAYSFALNQQMPRQTLQPGCRWVLYDPNTCTANKAAFSYTNAVGAGSTNVTITPATAISFPDGIDLAQGTITFTSGRNNGLSMSIQDFLNTGNVIRLSRPFLFPVNIGETFTVSAGCAHTFQNCQAFLGPIDSYIKYGGTPYIPNAETAIG